VHDSMMVICVLAADKDSRKEVVIKGKINDSVDKWVHFYISIASSLLFALLVLK
jgi:hypothetical protein